MHAQVSMLAGLCAAVHAFHARDLVLCNLQPEHFAWVSSKQPGWRLLNCSWWVRKGVAARPSYTLQYAAPEVGTGLPPGMPLAFPLHCGLVLICCIA